ncbi:MAG: hypothetical protein JXR22_13170 [Prolixibacteraceae bacterium]|nr:hypothetical protein [Prolixibacteraceae bacterium]
MKKIIVILTTLLLLGCYSQAQRNEITTLLGLEPKGRILPPGDVFQLKYTRCISPGFELQGGFRYHNYMEPDKGFFSEKELIIEHAYKMYKLDITALAVPINHEHFKLKVGIGADLGHALYAFANEYRIVSVLTSDGVIDKQYWKGVVAKTPEYGLHFVVSPNYYFNKQVYVTTQAFFNHIFDAEKFSPPIYRSGLLFFTAGIGFTF